MEVEIKFGKASKESFKRDKLLKAIYKKFKNSLWEKSENGYRVFI